MTATALPEEVDHRKLIHGRLGRLQATMTARGVGALLLTTPPLVRYATGVSMMPIWTALNLARYALVPVKGDPILFEYSKALHFAQATWPNARPAKAWQQRFSQHTQEQSCKAWAAELVALLKERGLADSLVGVDVLDHGGHEALKAAGLRLTDADPTILEAKRIKTPEELYWVRRSCRVADQGLAALQAAIRPGVTENELLAAFWGKMLSLGGEHCSTRLLVSGPKTNPWFQEAGERVVRRGELVAIDTDMDGPEGYLCDISRTFLCEGRAHPRQREAYAVARDFIDGVIDLCRPGIEHAELMSKVPAYPDEYKSQGYSCMIHGDGMDDEPPFLPYPDQAGAVVPIGRLEENMVLSVEFYAGKKGEADGVKLEEQILITKNGPVRLALFPHEDKLA